MEWLLEVSENVPPQSDDVVILDEDGPERFPGRKENDGTEIPINRYHWNRLEQYVWRNVGRERFTDGWVAFYDLIESPWWSRAWVFQEFVVSADASFLYGRRSASWAAISPILRSLCGIHLYSLANRNDFLDLTGYRLNGPEDQQFCRVTKRIQETNAQAAIDTVNFMVKTRLEWTGCTDLKQLLAHSRYCKASDDRDHIYAFLGLGSSGYDIVPNYSPDNGIVDVLIDTTRKIILFEDSLDVLAQAAAPVVPRHLMLPSWVADWTSREVSEYRDNHFGTARWAARSGINKEQACVSFRLVTCPQRRQEIVALETWGTFVDSLVLQRIDELINTPVVRYPVRLLTTKNNHMVFSMSMVQPNDELWILYGMTIPVILRPIPLGYYQLVACASFSMTDIVKDVERGPLGRQRISIL